MIEIQAIEYYHLGYSKGTNPKSYNITTINIKWNKLLEEHIKLNIDGAFDHTNNYGGRGGVSKNHRGHWIFGLAFSHIAKSALHM